MFREVDAKGVRADSGEPEHIQDRRPANIDNRLEGEGNYEVRA